MPKNTPLYATNIFHWQMRTILKSECFVAAEFQYLCASFFNELKINSQTKVTRDMLNYRYVGLETIHIR